MRRAIYSLSIAVSIFLIFTGCEENTSQRGEYDFEIHCINVGQGDCTLVIAPNGKTLLIDAGLYAMGYGEIVPYLEDLGIDSLQYIVATHYDADHIGGMDEVLNRIPLSRTAFDRGDALPLADTSTSLEQYLAAVEGRRQTMEPGLGHLIELDSYVSIRCVAANGNGLEPEDENDRSVCLVISYEDFDFFVGGDIAGYGDYSHSDVEGEIADIVGQVEGYQVNHHGSRYSSSEGFMAALQPMIAVISCGDNSFGHPHPDAVGRIGEYAEVIYQTADDEGNSLDNDVVISSNGTSFMVVTDRSDDEFACW